MLDLCHVVNIRSSTTTGWTANREQVNHHRYVNYVLHVVNHSVIGMSIY